MPLTLGEVEALAGSAEASIPENAQLYIPYHLASLKNQAPQTQV